jgi:hypothetical protein
VNDRTDLGRLCERLRTLSGALADRRRAAERASDLAGLLPAIEALREEVARLGRDDAQHLRCELTVLLDEAQALRGTLEQIRAGLAARLQADDSQRRAEAAYRRAGRH